METNLRRRGVIKREQVRVHGHGAHSAARPADPGEGPAPAPAAPAPRVRLVRLDEHTQAIEYTCACGEVALIEIHSEKKP